MVKVSIITQGDGVSDRGRAIDVLNFPRPVKEWMKSFGVKGSIAVFSDGRGW